MFLVSDACRPEGACRFFLFADDIKSTLIFVVFGIIEYCFAAAIEGEVVWFADEISNFRVGFVWISFVRGS